MLNFRLANIILFSSFFVLNALHFYTYVSPWMYFVLFSVYIAMISYGSSRVDSNFHFDVVCCGKPDSQGVMLTFDDGPNPDITPGIIEILEKRNIKAVFFIIGSNAGKYPDIIRKLDEKGHIIANHTYSHSYFFDLFPGKKMAGDIIKANNIVYDIIGKNMNWFRPPYGVTNPMLKNALKITGLFPIGWNLRSMDTVIKDNDRVIKRLDNIKHGDIVLFHDINKNSVQLLEDFLNLLKNKDIKIADPELIIKINAYN